MFHPGQSCLGTARRVFEATADQKLKTCKVFNDYSHSQFRWNQSTQNWVFQEGPAGPCGRVNIGILERDKSSNVGFWLYTERHITTNPSGTAMPGLSCSKFPDVTLNYTWRATSNFAECTYIENLMN